MRDNSTVHPVIVSKPQARTFLKGFMTVQAYRTRPFSYPGGPANFMNKLRPLITIGEAALFLGISRAEVEDYLNASILSGVTYHGVTMVFRNRLIILFKSKK